MGKKAIHLLVDSGTNFHIINDLKFFTGFDDVRDADAGTATGNGTVRCHQRGMATLQTFNHKGEIIIILVLVPDSQS